MTIGQRIREARKRLGLSGAELGRLVGVSRNAVSKWERDLSIPEHDTVIKLASVLGLPPVRLSPYGGDSVTPILKRSSTFRVPVLEWDELEDWAGGELDMTADVNRQYLQADNDVGENTIALKIKDESMAPEFRVNDTILIDPDDNPQEGDCVLVRIDKTGQKLFRHYIPRPGGAYDLQADNPEWPTITVNSSNPARLLGVLYEHRRKRRR